MQLAAVRCAARSRRGRPAGCRSGGHREHALPTRKVTSHQENAMNRFHNASPTPLACGRTAGPAAEHAHVVLDKRCPVSEGKEGAR